MFGSAYSSQILALQAAASIDYDGSTPITYGCAITRFSSGVYKLILPTSLGVIDGQSFTRVTAKMTPGNAGSVCLPVVSDETSHIKTITMFDNAGSGPTDMSIEVVVQRSTVNPF